mmetsp:Transcript_2953/g.7026  ORF Transcript_2953/g.7026 Transcript_2953/m.7026 type:complete len:207 (-) Transcript_2953:720-1340(-)
MGAPSRYSSAGTIFAISSRYPFDLSAAFADGQQGLPTSEKWASRENRSCACIAVTLALRILLWARESLSSVGITGNVSKDVMALRSATNERRTLNCTKTPKFDSVPPDTSRRTIWCPWILAIECGMEATLSSVTVKSCPRRRNTECLVLWRADVRPFPRGRAGDDRGVKSRCRLSYSQSGPSSSCLTGDIGLASDRLANAAVAVES